MNTDFSLKAQLYDTYRWDYPDEAISIIKKSCNITKESIIADFGAGTGKLTKHFDRDVKKIYAIEPDTNMASVLESKKIDNIQIIQKYSHEVTEINNGEADLILTGHALHWFQSEKTMEVFNKILNKKGHLVSINNSYAKENISVNEINTRLEKYVKSHVNEKKNMNTDKYFSSNSIIKNEIPFSYTQSFDQFINGLSSASFYPDKTDGEIFEEFKSTAKKVFDRYQQNGKMTFSCICTVIIGKLSY